MPGRPNTQADAANRYDRVMSSLADLLANNRQWAAQQIRRDPQFFERLCEIQTPDYLWIGCADSRVPASPLPQRTVAHQSKPAGALDVGHEVPRRGIVAS